MPATLTEQPVHSLEIVKEEEIAASIDDVFEAILRQLGPSNEAPGTGSMPMTLEAWPGGRWFRDLGKGSGHFWGHVQAIKPPTLIEICGPLFMSHPGISNVQFKLTEQNGLTYLRFTPSHGSTLWQCEIRRGLVADRGRLEQPHLQDLFRNVEMISLYKEKSSLEKFLR